jgi:hypothetical protein
MFWIGLLIGLIVGILGTLFVLKNNRNKVNKALDVTQYYEAYIAEKYKNLMTPEVKDKYKEYLKTMEDKNPKP